MTATTSFQLLSLPFVSDLHDPPSSLLDALLTERSTRLKLRAAEAARDAQRKDDTKDGYTKSSLGSERNRSVNAVLKVAQDRHAEAVRKATRAVEKHCRRAGLNLHPDRNGEETRESFERLTAARDVLRDEELRSKYVDSLLETILHPQGGVKYAKASHKLWVSRNLDKDDESNAVARPSSAGGGSDSGTKKGGKKNNGGDDGRYNTGPLQLQGGLLNDVPRKPSVRILDLSSRKIRIDLSVSDPYHFFRSCSAVEIYGDLHVVGYQERVIAKLGGRDLARFAQRSLDEYEPSHDLHVECTLPEHGTWSIRWRATLSLDGMTPRHTPVSHEADDVDLTSPAQIRRREELVALTELARKRSQVVDSTLRRLSTEGRGIAGGGGGGTDQAERRYWTLHGVVSKGRSTATRLQQLLREEGQTDTHNHAGLAPLLDALERAKPVQSRLEAAAIDAGRKSELKSFKKWVARKIESGDAARWIAMSTERDLRRVGGETNRLYQLLVEGKGGGLSTLVLDADTLGAAANRTDWFTAKQVDVLSKRRDDAEAASKADATKAVEEAAREREAEAEARKMKKAAEEREALLERLRVEWNGVPSSSVSSATTAAPRRWSAGDRVRLHGLQNAPQLNGTDATVRGMKDGDSDKYVILCDSDDQLRSVPGRFLRDCVDHHPSRQPAPTTTAVCATEDEDTEEEDTSADAAGGWSCPTCTLRHEGDLAARTSCEACGTTRWTKVGGTAAPPPPARKLTQRAAAVPPPRAATAGVAAPLPQKTRPKIVVAPVQATRPAATTFGSAARHSSGSFHSFSSRVEVQVPIPPTVVGFVIGKGGAKIKSISSESGAKVWIDQTSMGPNEMRIAYISGDKKAVDTAVRLVKATLTDVEAASAPRPVHTKRCQFGADCRWLHQGPDVCRFYHPPEDIEAAGFAVPGASPASSGPDGKEIPPIVTASPTAGDASVVSNDSYDSLQKIAKPPVPTPTQQQAATEQPLSPKAPRPQPQDMPLRTRKPSVPLQPQEMPMISQVVPPTRATNTVTPDLSSSTAHGDMHTLLGFLNTEKACIKGSPDAFCRWLQEVEDISNLIDLADAVSDDEYLREVLQPGDGRVGVKGFKRSAFKKAVTAAADACRVGGSGAIDEENKAPDVNQFNELDSGEIPPELYCPITHVLMTNDPVIASDGHTYERSEIEAWFKLQMTELREAEEELKVDPRSTRAMGIVERGVLSPVTQEKIISLTLTPNMALRTMARDHARANPSN